MVRLTHLLKNRIIISRMTAVTGFKQAFSTVTSEMGCIQPIGKEKAGLVDGVFGKAFRIYVEGDTDIRPGDRLRDENGNKYTVKSGGVTPMSYGSFDYKIVIIEKNK